MIYRYADHNGKKVEYINTTKLCDDHGKCSVYWDYTDQGDCPVCHELARWEKDLNEANNEIESLQADIDCANQQTKELEARNKNLETGITRRRGDLREALERIDELRSEADEINQQYAALEEKNKNFERLTTECEMLGDENKALKEQITEYKASLKDIKAELNRLNNVTGDNKDD